MEFGASKQPFPEDCVGIAFRESSLLLRLWEARHGTGVYRRA